MAGKESSPFETFTPENFAEEQLMIRDMCNQFLEAEIYPILDRIDNLEPGLMKSLVAKAGEQGFSFLFRFRRIRWIGKRFYHLDYCK